MKTNLIVLFCLLMAFGFSQKTATKEFKLKKSKLIESKLFSDIVTINPKSFKTIEVKFFFKIEGRIIEGVFTGDTISESLRKTFNKIDVGSTCYFDIFLDNGKQGEKGKSKSYSYGYLIIE